jgi:hypothetical protein
MHPIVIKFVTMEASQRYQIPDPLWQRFKIALNRVGAETAGTEALAAPGPSSKG